MPTNVIAANLFAHLTPGGRHAFGWMVSDGSEVAWQKHFGRADTPDAFDAVMAFADDGYGPEEEDIRFFVGHTRHATQGSPEIMANNHPISHGNIIGVHNGKVHNWQEIISKTGRSDDEAEVDSEAIFAAINKWGPVKGLSRLRTEAVTVWTDLRNPDRIHVARSTNRYLTIGWTDRGNMIFATERAALEQLWPMVRFVKFSPLSVDRLVTIQDGSVVSRRDIPFKALHRQPPKPKSFESRHLSDSPLGLSDFMADADAADRLAERRAAMASRRGEKIFPTS